MVLKFTELHIDIHSRLMEYMETERWNSLSFDLVLVDKKRRSSLGTE